MNPENSLPIERDFDPWGMNLDAQYAWKHFGGLTLDEAHAKFRENPLYHQEDFMFMGGPAFAYYFPVIEDHLRSVPDIKNEYDHVSWILAHCIQAQFYVENLVHIRHLASRVLELGDFVLNNIRRFGGDDVEQAEVSDAWTELNWHVRETTES